MRFTQEQAEWSPALVSTQAHPLQDSFEQGMCHSTSFLHPRFTIHLEGHGVSLTHGDANVSSLRYTRRSDTRQRFDGCHLRRAFHLINVIIRTVVHHVPAPATTLS